MNKLAVSVLWVVLGVAAHAAAQQAGNYTITGTVTSVSGSSCPFGARAPVTGVIYYPGPGHDTTQMQLQSVVAGKAVDVASMYAFPAVPADGLNGWSKANPVSPDYTQFRNGTVTAGGTAAVLSFDLVDSNKANPLAYAQGTIAFNVDAIAPCSETIQAILQKLSGFRQYPE